MSTQIQPTDVYTGQPGATPVRPALADYYAGGGADGYALVGVHIVGPTKRFSQIFGEGVSFEDVESRVEQKMDELMYESIGKDLIIDRWIYSGMYMWCILVAPRVSKMVDQQLLLDHSLFHGYTGGVASSLGLKTQVYVTKTYSKPSEYYLAAEEIDLRIDAAQFFDVETDVIGFHYNDFSIASDGESFDEIKLYYEKLFFNYTISYRFKDACDVFLKIIDLELTNAETAVSLKSRVPERLKWIMYILGSPAREPGSVMKNNVMVSIRELSHADSVSDMKNRVREVFEIIEEDYCGESDRAMSTFGRIVEFINENYADINLNSTIICDKFKITPAYLSRLFRRRTGSSMVDFVHGVRISHLKELLLSGDETIGSLCPKVGYASLWTMSRAFKKYEGITPSEYRRRTEK